MLYAEGLGKRYEERWVFRQVAFELYKGDALIVVGRNGCGKSTLLKIVAGLTEPTEGSVRRPPGDPRHTIGLSALDIHLYAHLTVSEQFQLAADLRGISPDWSLIESVGLGARRDQLAAELSSGTRARLKLVLAAQAKPSLLLLDEPGVSMDEAGKEAVKQICERQREHGCLIVATNDPLERSLGTLELKLAG